MVQQALDPETLIYEFTPSSEPRLSPDGKRILFTRTETNRETKKDASNLWLINVDDGNARRLTWTGEHNGNGRWSPDGTRIAFVSDRGEGNGIYLLPVAGGGEAREVTRHRSGIGDLAWSPDATRLAYTATYDPANPDETKPDEKDAPRIRVTRRIDYKWDGRGYLGDARRHVFVVDIANGQRRRLTNEPVEHNGPVWSPDGEWLAVGVNDWTTLTSRLTLIDVASGEARPVTPEGGSVTAWAWSPVGERIIYAGNDRWSPQPDFFVYNVTSRTVRRLTDDLASLPVRPLLWLDDRRVLFQGYQAAVSVLQTIDVESGAIETLLSQEATQDGLSTDDAKRVAAQTHNDFGRLDEIAVVDLASGTSRIVTAFNDGVLQAAPPATVERLEVQRGEFTIEGWLFKPPSFDPARRYPVVLRVHGGPESFSGYRFDRQVECLATHGFLVVNVNPRGSTSYGRRFTEAVLGDWGDEPYRDLMALLDEVLARPYADPTRTGIFGGSYGGYMTALAIGKSDRFAAAVASAVTFDLEAQYLGADMDHAYGEYGWGGPPHARRDFYEAQSPSSYAHRVVTPTLILHGEADERCPLGQAEEMFRALKKAGCEVEFVRYPGGSHGFASSSPPEHRVDALTRTLAWFTDHLGGPV